MPEQLMEASAKSAREALKNLKNQSDPRGRPLALCLMSETPDSQVFAASLLELGLSLDQALVTPSESLLAMIRLQWWIDELKRDSADTAPLVLQLRALIAKRPDLLAELTALITLWQDASQTENRNSNEGWQALWRLLAVQLNAEPEHTVIVGQFAFMPAPHDTGEAAVPALIRDKQKLLGLRCNAAGGHCQWLYLLACFGRYNHARTSRQMEAAQSPLLGWHILCWLFGLPPKL